MVKGLVQLKTVPDLLVAAKPTARGSCRNAVFMTADVQGKAGQTIEVLFPAPWTCVCGLNWLLWHNDPP